MPLTQSEKKKISGSDLWTTITRTKVVDCPGEPGHLRL